MRYNRNRALLLLLLVPLAVAGCAGNPILDPAEPAFAVANFGVNSTLIDNPYHPLVPGTVRIYQVDGEDGLETVVVEVLDITRLVDGIICAVVRDRVYIDELLIEDTHDWFAQDDSGNVWYMGEEVVNYEYDEEGNVIATDSDGAWEAGVDGAVPGILMKATLVVGDTYQQEFYAGEAEDMAAIHALNVPVTLANGMTYNCLQTREWTPLDPGVVEYKYYAPGIGQVAEEKVDGSDRGELTGTFNTGPGSLPDFGVATFSNPLQLTTDYLPYSPGNA